jgi:hypothetical protein
MTAAEVAAGNTLRLLLNEARLARIVEQNARFPNQHIELMDYLERIRKSIHSKPKSKDYLLIAMRQEIQFATERIFYNYLFQLATDRKGSQKVAATVLYFLKHRLLGSKEPFEGTGIDSEYLEHQWEQFLKNPNDFKAPPPPAVPPGQPIGCESEFR